jgi:peptide deformylase
MFLYIKRPKAIKVKYQNVKGEVIETVYAGITARIFLHEYDHMQGKNYTMYASRMKLDLAKKRFENKKRKLIKKFAQKQIINKLKETREANG